MPAWLRPIAERLPPTIKTLVIALSVVFGLYVMATPLQPFVRDHLALGKGLASGEAWQPLTALFIHVDPLSFFFDLLGLWFIGATVERSIGRMRFLVLFLGAGIAANLFLGLLIVLLRPEAFFVRPEAHFLGSGDAVLALFVGFGVLYGRTPVRVIGALVLEARWLSAILVGMACISALAQGALASLLGTLVAIVFAFFVSGGRWSDVAGAIRGKGGQRARYKVMDGGRSGRDPLN
jgi:membrane associated rhomboid family serine protease